jgi:cytochrome c-type biogenesis protein CcmF
MVGTIGQLLVLLSFVACGLAGLTYFRAAKDERRMAEWIRIARAAWVVMTVSVLGSGALLIYVVVTHQFQFAYVYEHSSLSLPLEYLVSASWAGQEGSFLLWILLNGLVGLGLIRWGRDYEATTMSVVALCQIFLISMILGLEIGPLSIGASPFQLLADKFPDAPMLRAGVVPADGSGLNDLLQNYWMVIHPPTLFVGFAAMIVPFAFAVSALWKKRYTDWVRPALPWALFASMILGVGIAMGGYWAYVTLSFGGYWAWDPVENSSLVPWLIGVAAVHTMIIQKRSGRSHKAALFLSILAYMFVVYSTFLTRSGILGDISVHSFVDLGLYNQLLLWILSMGVIGLGLFAHRYRELPKPTKEPEFLSREFMIFLGAMLLTAIAAVVILGTSSPILGRIFRDSPSTVPIAFYNKWVLPLSIGFVFLAGLGQLFWWNKMSVESVNKVLLRPIVLAVVSTIAILLFTPFVEETTAQMAAARPEVLQAGIGDSVVGLWSSFGPGLLLLLLVFAGFFALYGNGIVAWRIAKGNPKLAGGAIAHVGLAVMVLGVIASSGFSNPIARTLVGPGGQSRDNFVISRGETQFMSGYTVTYRGQELNDEDRPSFVMDFIGPDGRPFTLKPVTYQSTTQQWIQHPDVRLGFLKDLFVAVSPNEMFDTEDDDDEGTITLTRGDSTVLGDGRFVVRFENFNLQTNSQHDANGSRIVVGANIGVTDLQSGVSRTVTPLYVVEADRSVVADPVVLDEWDISIAFTGMQVDSGAIRLQVEGVAMAPEDWLVVQAYEKPLINLVWIGIIMISFGFVVAMIRRAQEESLAAGRQAPDPGA